MRQGEKRMFDNTYTAPEFINSCMMGPNCLRIAEELCAKAHLPGKMHILDLGCGTGLTSMFLADRYQANVLAADLWIDPSDNLERFRQFDLANNILPLRVEAHALPFAHDYFDAVVSIDAYHYFGAKDGYLSSHLLPCLREGALILLAVPGLQKEFEGGVPDVLQPYWQDDMHFHSAAWWRNLLSQEPDVTLYFCGELACHGKAWDDWLQCDNPYAVEDRKMMRAEAGQYFNTIGIIARKKQQAQSL